MRRSQRTGLAAFLLWLAWAAVASAHGGEAHAEPVWTLKDTLNAADGALVVLALILAGAPARLAAAGAPLPRLVPWLHAAGGATAVLGLGLALFPGLPVLGLSRLAAGLLAPGAALVLARGARLGRPGGGRWLLAGALVLAVGLRGLVHGPAAFGVNLLHLAGAALWLGALCWFALAPGSPEDRARFSDAAAWGLALSLLSGIGVTLLERGHGYVPNGTVLLVKHLLLVPVLALGWWHHRGRGGARTLRVEALLGAAVLAMGVGLTKAPPGAPAQPAAAAAPTPTPEERLLEARQADFRPPDRLPGWPVKEAVPPTTGAAGAEPARPGVHAEPLPEPAQVAALARGNVLVQYNCDCPDLVEKARQYVQGAGGGVILAPYPQMPSRLAVTAWGRIMVLPDWDEAMVRKFTAAHGGKGQGAAATGAGQG